MSSGLSVTEKYFKRDFQDGCHESHLGIHIGTIFAILDLQVIQILPTKFRVNIDLLVQEKKREIDFQDSHHGAILDFQSARL